MEITFKKYNRELPVVIPEYKTEGSAGLDLCSSSEELITIKHLETGLIPTNLILEISPGYEGQIRPRSGLALKKSVTVLNSPGTIDSDYRGEVKVLLINYGKEDFEINFGDRIAQLVIAKYEKAVLNESDLLSDTVRGEGGYGSTGVN
ncbi:MAG: dUTP diphosphatase [Ignavibacteria bacterium]|nr:dUTP diphosphatase [Ignavibacteria bacterium]